MKTYFFILALLLQGWSFYAQSPAKEPVKRISKAVYKYAAHDNFQGGILLAHQGEVVYQKALGKDTDGRHNELNSPFGLASMGKMFTGIAVAKLAKAGSLDYNDKLVVHLPQYAGLSGWEGIKIKHLLTHSSGLPGIFKLDFIERAAREKGISINEYFAHFDASPYSDEFFKGLPLEFTPGSHFSYSNTGYLLLGMIIEKLTGEHYATYVDREVIQPAKMDSTSIGTSYGGNETTLHDMLAFAKALNAHVLIEEQTYDLLTTGKIKTNSKGDAQWGYGFEIIEKHPSPIICHKGGSATSKAKFMVFPETDFVAIIYANNNKVGYKAFLKLIDTIEKELSK